MSKYRTDLVPGAILPANFVNALMEFLGTADANFALKQISTTSVQIEGSTGSSQVALGIAGLWRFNSAAASAAHPGGAAGQYDIFAVASANVFGGGDADTTDYSFGLRIVASGGTPTGNHNGAAITQYRKIGHCSWNGTAITQVTQIVGDSSRTPWATLADASCYFNDDAMGSPLTPRVMFPGGLVIKPNVGADQNQYSSVMWLDPADIAAGGLARLRIRGRIITEAPAFVGTATIGLHPVTSVVDSTTGTNTLTGTVNVGAAVVEARVAVSAVNQIASDVSAEIAAPAAGPYVLATRIASVGDFSAGWAFWSRAVLQARRA